MKHVEAVIRLFDPGYDVRRIAVRRRNKANPLLRKGTAWRNALGVLGKAETPLSVREVAERALTAKGIPLGPKAVAGMANVLHASFTHHKGKTIQRVGDGLPQRWILSSGC